MNDHEIDEDLGHWTPGTEEDYLRRAEMTRRNWTATGRV